MDIYTSSKLNKKKIIKVIFICILVIALITMTIIYLFNENFRKWTDKYILRKEISENSLATIKIDENSNPNVYAYNKHIAILEGNTLNLYNVSGRSEYTLDVAIANPIFTSNNRFLGIAEKNGQKVYSISDGNILWETDVEGNISSININKNGYVSVVVSGTTYKNVVIVYNPEGKELFKTFMFSTYAIDTDISNDNKYLSIAEMDFSGTLIQSNIKIISIEDAQKQKAASDSIKYTYNANSNDMIVNIKYQDRNKLICMYDNGIHVIQDNEDKLLVSLEDNNILFADINMSEYIAKVTKKSSGLFSASSELDIINTATGKESKYNFEAVPKATYVSDNVVGLNLGTECLFIGNNGWLIKKYISSQEVKDIVIADGIAGIIYKNKIELINL